MNFQFRESETFIYLFFLFIYLFIHLFTYLFVWNNIQ